MMYRPGYFHHCRTELGHDRPRSAPATHPSENRLHHALVAVRHGFRTAFDSGHVAIAMVAGNSVAALVLSDLSRHSGRSAGE